MKLLAISVLCCLRTCWAVFYIEHLYKPRDDVSNGEPRAMLILHKCRAPEMPDTIIVKETGETERTINCSPVTDINEQRDVYSTRNFYFVKDPVMKNQFMKLTDFDKIMSNSLYSVGYVNSDVDHPEYGTEIRDAYIENDFFLGRIKLFIVGEQYRSEIEKAIWNDLIHYLDFPSVKALIKSPDNAINYMRVFTRFLGTAISVYKNKTLQIPNEGDKIEKEKRVLHTQWNTNFMKAAIMKMIDPCPVLPSQPEEAKVNCTKYCLFINTAAQFFGRPTEECHSFVDGICLSSGCNCTQTKNDSGTSTKSVPMVLCNNALRLGLNLGSNAVFNEFNISPPKALPFLTDSILAGPVKQPSTWPVVN